MDRSNYFHRTTVYKKEDGKVLLIDREKLDQAIPMDPWLGLVVSLADGQHTIEQMIGFVRQQYQDAPPVNLEKTIDSALERLVESEVVVISKTPYELPYYLAVSQEEQNPTMAIETRSAGRRCERAR